MWVFARSIVEAAAEELRRCGEALEDLAGIEWVEDEEGNRKPARDLTEEEVLFWSIEKLGDDGRMYEVFPTDERGAEDFVDEARHYGLEKEARDIVEEFNS
jgi:hypothetical protein